MTKLRMEKTIGFSGAIDMPTRDMPPEAMPARMTNPTAAACAVARRSMLHNGGLRHRNDQQRS